MKAGKPKATRARRQGPLPIQWDAGAGALALNGFPEEAGFDVPLQFMPVTKRKAARPPLDSPDRRRLPVLLRRAWYGLNQAFRRRIAHLGITPDQFTVMRTLLEQDGITQRELAHLISSDPNTVASLVNRMEKAGLLERETHERDRRANRLRLAAQGRILYEAARVLAVELQTEVLAAVPASRREQFLEDLNHLADACRLAAQSAPLREPETGLAEKPRRPA